MSYRIDEVKELQTAYDDDSQFIYLVVQVWDIALHASDSLKVVIMADNNLE